MSLKMAFLAAFGLCAGGVIAAGVFAFLTVIGAFPRMIGKTKTKARVMLYETVIILGGAAGNAADLFEFPIPAGGTWALAAFGLAAGIFVGCLVMSLAETLKTLPVISRRIRLSAGIQYVILAIGLGKMAGAFFYFFVGMGAGA